MAEIRILAESDCAYDAIAAALLRAGLSELPSTLTTPPLIPGEPEFAAWSTADGATRANYGFDPVVALREIALAGPQALAVSAILASALPLLDEVKLHGFLADGQPRTQLLGIRGAVALGAFTLIGEIEALRIGPDRHVTAAAAQAVEALTLAMLALGEARLEAERRRVPGRSALFPRLGDAATRRAIVVALLDDRDASPLDVAPVLRAALNDPEWEVRVAAMLVTVRLGLRDLWPDVRAMDLPHTSRSGLDGARRDVLRAARKAALDLLADRPFDSFDHAQAAFLQDLRAVVGGTAVATAHPLLTWLHGLAGPPPIDGKLVPEQV